MKRNAKHSFPNRWFWIALLVPVGVLLSMTVQPLLALYGGERITLQTIPVDPKDLFYGDYVQLRLAIEEVDASLVEEDLAQKVEKDPDNDGFPVYVSLRRHGQTVVVTKVSEQKPQTSLYLKGKLFPFSQSLNDEGKKNYLIDYQLDRYYVEEGHGMELEKLSREGKVWADVKVKGGYGVLVDVKPAP
ncbi:GDYXXLXY domain-containing protein [Laceyella putida]|uniref:GDYXXLXY domain-containing protein n=1 Tax=Laceyella putida TaxID=110101 RepID=A0ABW2RHI4_9BACL